MMRRLSDRSDELRFKAKYRDAKWATMAYAKLIELVRQFPENGMKLMLQDPANVRDVLALLDADWMDLVDFSRLRLVPTTFVERDYRHVESDVVLAAPLRGATRSQRRLLIYILIEHQSEPDRLMPLRVLEYVVQVYKHQTRRWSQRHRSFVRVQLEPVVPVVFYTGDRRWSSPGTLSDLVALSERFGPAVPVLEPLFLNLGTMAPTTLESQGGFFGWVLRLVQQRRARPAEFRGLLSSVVRHLETMPPAERLRWLELLSYIHALVYHERHRTERPTLAKTIEASVETDEHRQEIFAMGKTIAQDLIDKGRTQGKAEGALEIRRATLLRLLRKRFRAVPADVSLAIDRTDSVSQLDEWLDRFATATRIDEIGFERAK